MGPGEVWWIDSRVDVTLTASQTGGRVGMWTWVARRGAAAPLHVHPDADEWFLVLEGTARFLVGGERVDAEEGGSVFLPRGVPHAYLVTSDGARLVGGVSPGGMEGLFTELGTPVVPGAPEPPPPGVDALAAAAPRYGVEILGPPPALA